jgi:hypothetical protein
MIKTANKSKHGGIEPARYVIKAAKMGVGPEKYGYLCSPSSI